MDTFGRHELRELTQQQPWPCVTVYLPTHVAGDQAQQDPVRLKNLLQEAETQLIASGVRAADAREMLDAARALPSDPAFWENRSHGLALFIHPDRCWRFRLPIRFDELVVVHKRFHLKAVLPMITGEDRFYVLALSQNRTRLLLASQYTIEEVDVPGLPGRMKEALNYVGADRGSQVHSAMRGDAGKQGAVFHGQGGQRDAHKDELQNYFRLVDAALQPVLGEEQTPLLLAGVDYLLPIYREVNSYPFLANQQLEGNTDRSTVHEVHQRAWPLIGPQFEDARRQLARRYRERASGELTSNDIRVILPAAHQGRVDGLFVSLKAQLWGSFDPETEAVELHETHQSADDDLLDQAAIETLLRRGLVYAVDPTEVPSGTSAAAVFRY